MSPELEDGAVDITWVSASATRNALLQDWLLDWLNLYGEPRGFVPDTKRPDYDARTDFTRYLFDQAQAFEAAVLAHTKTLVEVTIITHERNQVRSSQSVDRTFHAMKAGVPVIYQGVLHDAVSKTYGAPDFMFRSDVLQRLFPSALSEGEATTAAPRLKQPFHYRVVDAKFTTLDLLKKSGELANSGSSLAYQGQLYIYQRALANLQGVLPSSAYLLGRGWRQGKERGSSAFARLAPVNFHREIKDGWSLDALVDGAAAWVRRLRMEGSRWSVLPEPSQPELWPNLSQLEDGPWHTAKKEIADELCDLTLLWQVGFEKRRAAHELGLKRWSDPRCSAQAVGVLGANTAPKLDRILEINRNETGPPVRPERVRADEAAWRPRPDLEFFVDFETTTDLNDDFSQFPRRGGSPLICMIGCGHIENNQWVFRVFTVDHLVASEEATIIEAWLEHMKTVRQRLTPAGEAPRVFHWSKAEVSFLETAYNSATARHPDREWASVRWYDLLQNVIRAEPLTVQGAFGFGLKTIARALHRHAKITTRWNDGPSDGLGAMVGLWRASEEARAQGVSLGDVDIVKDIERYNEIDCRAMAEVLDYLRKNH